MRRWLIALAILVALAAGLGALYWFSDPEKLDLDDAVRRGTPGQFVRLSDGFTHYELGGPPTGRLVVLAAGFSVPYYIWDPTFSALTEAGVRVLRYDYYGRGFSDRPDVPYDQAFYVRQLAELPRCAAADRSDRSRRPVSRRLDRHQHGRQVSRSGAIADLRRPVVQIARTSARRQRCRVELPHRDPHAAGGGPTSSSGIFCTRTFSRLAGSLSGADAISRIPTCPPVGTEGQRRRRSARGGRTRWQTRSAGARRLGTSRIRSGPLSKRVRRCSTPCPAHAWSPSTTRAISPSGSSLRSSTRPCCRFLRALNDARLMKTAAFAFAIAILLRPAVGAAQAGDASRADLGGRSRGRRAVRRGRPAPIPIGWSASTSRSRVAVARGLGRTPRFVNVTFTSIDQSIARGDADIGLSGIEDTPARRAAMAVTIPYYEFREVLSVRDADAERLPDARRSARPPRRRRSAARSPTKSCCAPSASTACAPCRTTTTCTRTPIW